MSKQLPDETEYHEAIIVEPGDEHALAAPGAGAERVVIVEKEVADYVLTKIDGAHVAVPVFKANGDLGHPMHEAPRARKSPPPLRKLAATKKVIESGD